MQFDIYNGDNAEQQDIVNLIGALCCEINFNWQEKDVRDNFAFLTNNKNLVTFLAIKENKLVGILGFYVTREIFNSEITRASEAYWYIMPKHRGNGFALLDYAESSFNEGTIIELGIHSKKLLNILIKCGYISKKVIIEKVL